jgi:hypothetical protein
VYVARISSPSSTVKEKQDFAMQVELTKDGKPVAAQAINQYISRPAGRVKCRTLSGGDWAGARTDASGISKATCIADAPGRATVTVVFLVNDNGKVTKVEDSHDINVQVITHFGHCGGCTAYGVAAVWLQNLQCAHILSLRRPPASCTIWCTCLAVMKATAWGLEAAVLLC